jgi:hypothetical protein
MTKDELLDKIIRLEKVIEQKDQMILDLQRLLMNNQNNQLNPFWDNDQCDHEYPSPWHGVIPPHCKKCGKQAPKMEITFGDGTGDYIPPQPYTTSNTVTVSGSKIASMIS